jgi:putative addiction module component (TIGR02574 family)
LQLAPEPRAALAASLLDSLDEQGDEGAEEEWRTVIERRMAELNSGTVRTVPWTDVRERVGRHFRR